MVWTSQQTSHAISAQNAAMYNQAAQAGSVSAQLGLSEAQPMPPMSAPVAPSMAGAVASGLGASATAIGMADMVAGGLAGGLGGGVMAHSYAPSATTLVGHLGRAGHVGRAALSGFGRGALGGVMGAAALPVVGGLMAAQQVAHTAHVGSQQATHVRAFTDSNLNFINPTRASGRGMGTGEVAELTRELRDIAHDTSRTFDDVMSNLRDINDMGLLNTARNAKDVSRRVRQVMKTVDTIADAMGVTMKEAMGFYGSSRLSGMFTDGAIAGNMIQRGVLGAHGFTGQQFTQLQRGGAQIAQQFGARRGQGARMITRFAGDVARAGGLGIIDADTFVEATGREAGPEAYAQIASTMSQAALRFTQTGLGKAALAYAGEVDEEGRFTGRIDAARMRDLQQGRLSQADIMRGAQERLSSRGARTSFARRMRGGRLAGDFAERGGTDVIGQLVQQIAGERFGEMGRDDIATLLMERFAGLDEVHAEMLADLARNQTQIARARRREEVSELQQAIRDQERKLRPGFLGTGRLSREIGREWRQHVRDPIQQWGAAGESLRAMRAERRELRRDGAFRSVGLSSSEIADIATGQQALSGPIELRGIRGFFARGRAAEELGAVARERLGAVDNPLGLFPGSFTGEQLEAEQSREMRRATGTLELRDTGLQDISQEDLQQATRELLRIMGPDFDLKNAGASRTLAVRASGRQGRDAETLQRLMRQVTGQTGTDEPLVMSRQAIGQRADLMQFILQEGAGARAVGTRGRFGIAAYSAEAQRQFDRSQRRAFGANRGLFRGDGLLSVGLGREDRAAMFAALEDPEARDTLLDTLTVDTSSKEAMQEDVRARKDELTRYITLKSNGLEIPEELQKFEALGEDGARAALSMLRHQDSSFMTMGRARQNQAALQQMRDLSGSAVGAATRESRRSRGAALQRTLEGEAGKTLRGRGRLGSDVAAAAQRYADAVSGEGSGVDEAAAIADRIRRAGRGQQRQVMQDLRSLGGGMADQVQALLDSRELVGSDTTMEDLESFFTSKNVGVSDSLRARLEEMVADKKIVASEADELGRSLANAVGDQAAQETAAVGGASVASAEGGSLKIARMLLETDRQHAIFASTTAAAVERIADAAGIEANSSTQQVAVQPAN